MLDRFVLQQATRCMSSVSCAAVLRHFPGRHEVESDRSQASGLPAALDVVASPSLRHTRPEIFPSNVSCMHPPAVDSTSPLRAKVPVAVANVAAISATNDPCNSPAKYSSVSWLSWVCVCTPPLLTVPWGRVRVHITKSQLGSNTGPRETRSPQ